MKKIWIRLGGNITADEDTYQKIMSGDEEALVKAIKEHGFELNGEPISQQTKATTTPKMSISTSTLSS